MPPALALDVITGIGINNSASVSNGAIIGGNSTDRALMGFLVSNQVAGKMNKAEVREFSAFDSNKKSSSVTICRDGEDITYIKGAPEKLYPYCTSAMDCDGKRVSFRRSSTRRIRHS